METVVSFYVHAFLALFAIVNPIGNLPVFLTLTADFTDIERKQVALRSCLTAFFIAAVFAVAGKYIMSFFGITISAFRAAGGMLLFFIAFRLLQGQVSHVHHPHKEERDEAMDMEDISVIPIAMPILAGPGTITTVMSLAATNGNRLPNLGYTLSAFLMVIIVTYLLFRFSPWITQRISKTGLNVVSRLMGLILAVIGVQMIADGLTGLFPGLK